VKKQIRYFLLISLIIKFTTLNAAQGSFFDFYYKFYELDPRDALLIAAEAGYFKEIKNLYEQNTTRKKVIGSTYKALFIACQYGHLKIVQYLCTKVKHEGKNVVTENIIDEALSNIYFTLPSHQHIFEYLLQKIKGISNKSAWMIFDLASSKPWIANNDNLLNFLFARLRNEISYNIADNMLYNVVATMSLKGVITIEQNIRHKLNARSIRRAYERSIYLQEQEPFNNGPCSRKLNEIASYLSKICIQ
jgi:hypothetical protein